VGILGKISRSFKNPKKAAERTFTRIDEAAGRKVYGNTVGLRNNLSGSRKIDSNLDPELKITNPTLYNLKTHQYSLHNNEYNDSLMASLKEKYDSLIEDDKFSFPTAGYEEKIYCRHISDAAINFPELSKLLTNDVKEIVRGYFDSDFSVKHIACWRNYHVPEELRKQEMFSNFWHFDRREISELKFFVYFSDVSESDGPFHVQSRDRTKELMKMGFKNRQDYGISLQILEDPEHVRKVTGKIGTTYFGNANVCLHRAGDPAKDHARDMVQFVFVPSKNPLSDNWLEDVTPLSTREYSPNQKEFSN
jgi:hypothetical protein